MTELERKILQTFAEAFPGMTEAEKDRLLCFGEGMATMADARTQPRASCRGATRKEGGAMLPYERTRIERALAVVGRNGRLVLLDDYYTDEERKELLKALELLTAEAAGK